LIFTKSLPYLTSKYGKFSIFSRTHLNDDEYNIVF
jgi:hypothetical protein